MKSHLIALCLFTAFLVPVWAQAPQGAKVDQSEAGQDTGPAMPDPTLALPPQEVKAKMRAKGITVRWEPLRLDGERVWLHVYTVPKARNKYSPMPPKPGHEKDPLTRKDIFAGAALESSPFYTEIYAPGTNGTLTRLHQARYESESDVNNVSVRYIQPAKKAGPLLLLESGFTHWKQSIVIGFPKGVRGKSSFTQVFEWGGEGDVYTGQQFDQIDSRGYLQVVEVSSEDGGKHEKRVVYRWDGTSFTDPDAHYFVIAAATPTRAECEEYVRANALSGQGQILESRRYSNLKPGLFIVVVAHSRTAKDAQAQVKMWKARQIATYAKRAF